MINDMTHEFQTPIAAIKMAADMLASQSVRENSERFDKYIRMIQEESQRLQQQMDLMLTVARTQKWSLSLHPESIDLHTLIYSLSERHGDYLHLDLQAQWSIIQADRLHFTNVLCNLLDNAVKYSPVNPSIWFSSQTENNYLVIAIKDNGIGIASEYHSRIFHPFYRVPGVEAHTVKGFGLGLNYVRKIVQAHQWTIELESAVGKGSTFVIRIPKQTEPSILTEKEAIIVK